MREPGGDEARIESLSARPLSVALIEPFVIATGRVDVTHSVEIEARVARRGRAEVGLGEAACLPPVTVEDQADVIRAIEAGVALGPVARAGVETAVMDALARLDGIPLRTLLGGAVGARTNALETDVTIAIAEPAKMGELARTWTSRGFRALKVKVGKDVDSDARALEAIARAAPAARMRIDANAGYSVREALALARACKKLEIAIECWEQPCAADDLDGMAEVAAAVDPPVIADESVKTLDDLRVLIARRYADGVNLKLAKSGGLLAAHAIGIVAKSRGLRVMVGGMVETRLGMTAAANLACALGGVDFVDLDTAWLLAADPYEGGYAANGPFYTMPEAPGLAVKKRID